MKKLLRSYNLKPNFTYGQNFLIDNSVLQDIVEAAEITPDDKILEIGPGIGSLTRKLCERAGFVLSVEKDPKFLPILKSIKKDFKNFRWEIADALEFDYVKYIESANETNLRITTNQKNSDSKILNPKSEILNYKVVANIPYYITGKIIQMLLAAKCKPESITILTQKEVAQNITASAGGLSVLAISVQLFGEPKIVKIVPAESFYPKPKVDSAILKIELFSSPRYEIANEKKIFQIIKACFAGKRKQIHNTLVNNLKLSKQAVGKALLPLNISPASRPQELTIEQWLALAKKL